MKVLSIIALLTFTLFSSYTLLGQTNDPCSECLADAEYYSWSCQNTAAWAKQNGENYCIQQYCNQDGGNGLSSLGWPCSDYYFDFCMQAVEDNYQNSINRCFDIYLDLRDSCYDTVCFDSPDDLEVG